MEILEIKYLDVYAVFSILIIFGMIEGPWRSLREKENFFHF